jgi:CheY-like chemotaxis protein
MDLAGKARTERGIPMTESPSIITTPAVLPALAAPQTTASVRWRVLVAEDIPSQQKLLLTVLKKYGHTVHTASDGEEAVNIFQHEPLDVILMDLQMPGLNGLDAMRAIRAREIESGGHVPIVAVTAHALLGDQEKCLAAGADFYLRKPLNLAELMAVLTRLIDDVNS